MCAMATAARAAIFAVAIVVCAWFALGVRQAHDIDQATSIITGAKLPTPAQAEHAQSLLNSADWLYPGTEAEILRGRLAIEKGQRPLAQRIERNVTREEPMNLSGWVWLANSYTNPKFSLPVIAHVLVLDPKASGKS